jgi:signal transduction histidine kinase
MSGVAANNPPARKGLFARLRMMWKVTAFRLTLIFLTVFVIFSLLLVSVSLFTVTSVLHNEARTIIDDEIGLLRRVERRGGLPALIRTVDMRARAPGASLFLLIDASGRIYAGNVQRMPSEVLKSNGRIVGPFEYQLLDGLERRRAQVRHRRHSGRGQAPPPPQTENQVEWTDSDKQNRRALARVVNFQGGLKLMVGRDFGQPTRFRTIIGAALIFMVVSLALIAIGSWLLLGRRALARIERVSLASQKIAAGDLAQRLPTSGADDEFDRLARSLNSLLEKIQRLDGGVKDMADSVAHDLKTPLTRLRNRADMALTGESREDPEELRAALEDMMGQSDQTIRMFNALLMISRVEAGSQAGSLMPVDLAAVVADIADLYEAPAEDVGMRLETNMDGIEKSFVSGNRELLAQAISNLIENALKYAGEHDQKLSEHEQDVTNTTVISLGLTSSNGHLEVVVADSGPGIVPEDRDRVKQRFVRLDKSRTRPGSGLGLALVDAVCKLHGGALELSDNAPGLKVVMRLPKSEQSEK